MGGVVGVLGGRVSIGVGAEHAAEEDDNGGSRAAQCRGRGCAERRAWVEEDNTGVVEGGMGGCLRGWARRGWLARGRPATKARPWHASPVVTKALGAWGLLVASTLTRR